jgi:hypothetical protein
VRLLIDDAFATSTYTAPIVAGWVTPPDGLTFELLHNLSASNFGADDAALAPSFALTELSQSHHVHPNIAVIADGVGAAAMRTPVRPDEIEATPVRLLNAGEAELLARATLQPFYGITPTNWIRDGDAPEAARAEVVVVAGAEALREPEGGFSEDLSRAWFILTAQPVVSHVLLLPEGLAPEQQQRVLDFLAAARGEGLARRREWRAALADREEVSRDRAGAFWAAQRLELQEADRQALRALLRQGSAGLPQTHRTNVTFWEGDAAT